MTTPPTIHASAVLAGAKAVLIRGEAGSGKSRLALSLLQAAENGGFARLVGDDRIHLEARNGRLLARPAQELAGMLEVRGVGIQRMPYEPVAVVGLVIELGQPAERLPAPASLETSLNGVKLARLAFPSGADPLPTVLKALDRRFTLI